MIVIEGCDGTGKSTLTMDIAAEFHLQVGKRGTPHRDRLYKVTRRDTYTALAEAVRGHAPPQVWDRLFWSEMVYCQIAERTCEFTPKERKLIAQMLAVLGIPHIMCMPPLEVILANTQTTHQMKGVKENIQKIDRDYRTLFHDYPGRLVYYDYTGYFNDNQGFVTREQISSYLASYIKQRKERQW